MSMTWFLSATNYHRSVVIRFLWAIAEHTTDCHSQLKSIVNQSVTNRIPEFNPTMRCQDAYKGLLIRLCISILRGHLQRKVVQEHQGAWKSLSS